VVAHGAAAGVAYRGGYSLPNHPSAAQPQLDGDQRTAFQYNTTEVPDFAALQERSRRKTEKYKFERRQVTEPEPFAFISSKRAQARALSAKARAMKQTSDPTTSLAWQRGGKRGRSIPSLQRPPLLAVPRSTEKARASHDFQAARIAKLRTERQQKLEDQENVQAPNPTVLKQLQAAISKTPTSHSDYIENRVRERRSDEARLARGYKKRVADMNAEAQRMPLLMERSAMHSWKTRSRQRALSKVQEALKSRGLSGKGLLTEDEELEAAGQ
jgi:hypothetical protein